MSRHAFGVIVRSGKFVAAAAVVAAGLAAPAGAAASAGVTAPARLVAGPGPGPGPDAGVGGRSSGPARQVLLLNGNRVLAGSGEAGPGVIEPPAGETASTAPAGAVLAMSLGGASYDIPYSALPYVGRGLDLRLFEVGALLAQERGGRLPVSIRYHGHLPTLPGVTVTGSGGGNATGYLTDASARAFGAALQRQFAADHARASYGTDGLFAAGTTIALAGTAATPAAPPRFPMHILTFKATDLSGKPDTGDFVQVFSVDKAGLIAAGESFYRGVAKLSVPAGHYFALGEFGGTSPKVPLRMVVLPQFTVAGDTTVDIHESAANSKLTMVTPRPVSAPTDTGVWFKRTCATGGPIVLEALFTGGYQQLWFSPTHVKPTVGTVQMSVNRHLESPPGPGVPYEYTLSFTSPPGLIPSQRHVVTASDLATLNERFYQAVKTRAGWDFNGSMSGTNANNNTDWFGFIEPEGNRPFTAPGRLTEYAGGAGTARMLWGEGYGLPGFFGAGATGRTLRPGEHLTENWGAYPLHPSENVLLTTLPDMFWFSGTNIPSAVRTGNSLQLEVDPFSDSEPGHGDGLLPFTPTGLAGTYKIDQNGTKIASGDAVKAWERGPGQDFYTKAALSPKPSTIRFSLRFTRASSAFPLPTATSTVWAWRSAPVTGAKLPSPWTCVLFTYRPDGCAAQPMMTLGYQVAHLGMDGRAPAGTQAVHLQVGHIQLARAATITKTAVSVSFDGGKSWRPARVTGQVGSYTAAFTAPAGATVSLRTSAADAAGGSVTETITGAFRVAS